MTPIVLKWFGLRILLCALVTDIYDRSDRDYAFWTYIFGVFALWSGLSYSASELLSLKLLYLSFNLLLIAIGACLIRKVFIVLGSFGILFALGNLSRTFFKDEIAFSLTLTVLGWLTIALGIWWQRNEAAIQQRLTKLLPATLNDLRQRRA